MLYLYNFSKSYDGKNHDLDLQKLLETKEKKGVTACAGPQPVQLTLAMC